MSRGRTASVGDTRVSKNGYHYTRTEAGWVLTHRLIAEETIGRSLRDEERIRYKDGDRTNLDPDNIEVYTGREKSKARKVARLKARIEELQAELELVESE